MLLMSKIAIATLPLRLNYGGILQAYALQSVLERMGNDVEVVQVQQRGYSAPKGIKAPFVYGRRAIFKCLGLSDTPVFAEKQLNTQWPVISEHTRRFINQYIHVREISSYDEIDPKDYDVFVVGSDQVWRPEYSDLYQCFLQFAENWDVKRIAYAASFGTDQKEYTAEQVAVCKSLIKKFDAVSVREDSGVNLCEDYFGVCAQHVLDPTLLLDKEDYISLVEASGIVKSEGDLFVYILDPSPEKTAIVEDIAAKKHLTPFTVKAKSDYNYAPLEDRIQPPVEQWLRGFMDAKFVVTDSFHGCVFSILFNKPFMALGNSERGMARFTSLFKLFNLMEKLIKTDKFEVALSMPIDWRVTNRFMKDLRIGSTSYLKGNTTR